MTEVISVRFRNKGKVYFFEPNGLTVEQGAHVIVETAKGLEFAECVSGNHEVDDAAVHPPLRPVIRIAAPEDVKRAEDNRRKEKDAFEVCRQRIAKHGLDMKLVDVEYNFEGSKILFFFTSEGRVDFRELVKDLAGIFKTRIELRQIGVRDEARMLGGLGICGRPFCCAQFLDDFQPVSIKMAKTQGLSLNPTKISGSCGRLMCCLKYEQDAYEELVQCVPKVDAFVETPAGVGMVVDVNLLKGTVRVHLEEQNDMAVRTFQAGEVTVLGGKAKRAEYLAARAEGLIEAPQPRLAPSKPKKSRERGENRERPENRDRNESRDRSESRERSENRDRSEDREQVENRDRSEGRERSETRETADGKEPQGGAQAEGEQKSSQRRNRGGRSRQPRPENKKPTPQRQQEPRQRSSEQPRQNEGQPKNEDQRRSQSGGGRRKRYRHNGPRRTPDGGQPDGGEKHE